MQRIAEPSLIRPEHFAAFALVRPLTAGAADALEAPIFIDDVGRLEAYSNSQPAAGSTHDACSSGEVLPNSANMVGRQGPNLGSAD